MVTKPINRLFILAAAIPLAFCDLPWMETHVHLRDGTQIKVQHRANGTFRTIVYNTHGYVLKNNELGGDERYVCLYRSPSGLIIITDGGAVEMVVRVSLDQKPSLINALSNSVDGKQLRKWKLIGSVRRTSGDVMTYSDHDDYCRKG